MDLTEFIVDYWPYLGMLFGITVIAAWARTKGKDSIFAQDTSLEDVGVTLVSEIGANRGRDFLDGRRELRPPFGTRAIAPFVLLIMLIGYGPRELMSLAGLTDPTYQTYAILAFWVLFAYTLFELNVRQRVIYGHGQISVWGVNLRRQDRDLSELVAIEVHEKRPALVLTFADGSRLYAPKHLNGRARFLREMKAIIADNQSRGLRRPAQGQAARLGF